MENIIGWCASIILVLTIARQIYRQWQEGSSKGVSKWLFIGQITASAGFLLYSWLRRDPVFMFTNAVLLLASILGLSLVYWHRRVNPDEADG